MAADLSIVPDELKPDDGNGDDDAYNRGWNACCASVLAALRAEAGAVGDDKDGERYRWLRDKSPRTSERGKHGLFIGHGSVYSGFGQPYREDMDKLVDCAMQGGDTWALSKRLGQKRTDKETTALAQARRNDRE